MSLYNTVRATVACPGCAAVAEREIQFRYGHVWQHEYVLGSTIAWGPAAVGDRDIDRVVVDGWIDACDACSVDGRVALFLRDGIIWGVGPVTWQPGLPEQGWIEQRDEPR